MNIPFNISEADVKQAFSKFGPIEAVDLPLQKGAKSKGYAFVLFSQESSAIQAYAEMDEKVLWGRKIHIKPA